MREAIPGPPRRRLRATRSGPTASRSRSELAVAVRVEGDEIDVDYAGSSPQSERGINVVLNYTAAYTTFALKCAIGPEVPNNEGSFRPGARHGARGLHPERRTPRAGRRRGTSSGTSCRAPIFGALAQALPERVLAQGADSLWNTQITGQKTDGEPFTYVFFSGGGMGARPESDGLSATAFPSGIRGVPAEVIESISPVVMHKRELRPDSEGAGRHRGGFGQEMELGVRGEDGGPSWTLSAMYDRTRFPAPGMLGGRDGAAGSVGTASGETLHPKRQQRIPAGEHLVLKLPGGGGYGDLSNATPSSFAATSRTVSSPPSAPWRPTALS